MKGKLSCPYRGSDPPVQGRSKPRTGENADPRREEPPPRPPRKKNTRTEAFASRARARSWNNWFRKKPGLVLFPSPFLFLLRGSRGKFSFPLPFSLTLQTAPRRLLTTHPYSSDFPFVVLLFVLARDHPTARNFAICRVGQPANKKRPSGIKPEGLKKA